MLRPQFVLFGDSLTQRSLGVGGWGSLLADAYVRKVDVVNRGYSGFTTRWALPLLPHVFPRGAPPPALVTLFFGANDASLPNKASARQHVPLPEYRANLAAVLAHLRAVGARHVLLITPPPLDEAARAVDMAARHGVAGPAAMPERTNEATARYAAAVVELAAAERLPVLDLFDALQADAGWQSAYLEDGLHFTPAGQARVYALLQAAIDVQLPQLSAVALPTDFPLHSELDGDDYAAVIDAHLAACGADGSICAAVER